MKKSSERKRLRLTGVDRAILVVLAVMALITVVINVMKRFGLWLIRGELYLILPLTILVVAVGWGLFRLLHRIKSRPVRIAANVIAAVALLLIVMVGMSYLTLVIGLSVPQRYAVVRPENGARALVVLRQLDPDETRIEIRRAARLEANPDAGDDVVIEDWGYVYTAYAEAGGQFYRPESLIEGEVYIGYASQAELMVDWEEDRRVGHFFVKNPEPGDSGEMRARLE